MTFVRSRQRVADHGEVFTPAWVVEAMLDLVRDESFRVDSRVLEPACGSGNFLVSVLARKLAAVEASCATSEVERRRQALLGLSCIHGIELLDDNVAECRQNMLAVFADRLGLGEDDPLHRDAADVLAANIVHGDALTMLTAGGEPIAFAADTKFDVVIGNPPYQLDDGGYGTSAAPIYDRFVERAKALGPRLLTMVIPARWFAGGKGLDGFRAGMLADDRLRSIDDHLNASDVFPDIGLKGGICYFLWDRDDPGPCRVTTHFRGWDDSTATRPLLEPGADVFIRFNEGLSILRKVVAVESGQDVRLSLPEDRRFDRLVSSRKPFGLETTFRGKASPGVDDVLVHQNGGIAYAARASISSGTHLIDRWKLFAGYAAPGTGNRDTYPHRIISTPFIGEPGSICSETYLCIGPFESSDEAASALSYLSCRLTRLLILLHKSSQHTTRKVYAFVPAQDWTRCWTDEDLYARYSLSDGEIGFIEKVVRPMDLTSGDRLT